MWQPLATLVLIAACVENTLGPLGDAADGVGESSGADTARSVTCSGVPPEDATVTLSTECTMPMVDWNLRNKWTWDTGPHRFPDPHVGRLVDSDGDGEITTRDDTELLVSDPFRGYEENPVWALSGEGDVVAEDDGVEGWGMFGTIGDVEPTRVGMEYLMLGISAAADQGAAAAADVGQILYDVPIGTPSDYFWGPIFLADLDADGAVEVIGGATVSSASDGALLFSLGETGSAEESVAADLDLDGMPEIVVGTTSGPVILDNTGVVRARCLVSGATDGDSAFESTVALGNLDDDPEGEIVVARPGVLAICEADGTVDHEIATSSLTVQDVAIAELTSDSSPDIVVAEWREEDAAPSIAAYDRALNLLWRHVFSTDERRARLAVADLDGDGRHEVIVHRESGSLVILGPDGILLGAIDAPLTSGLGAPIIADIDGDGLAEIILTGEDTSVAVYTNDAGGWPVVGAEDPWPGIDHFPGDRNLDGTLPNPGDVAWLIPGHNVWNGLAPGREALPDLGVSITGACSDDCVTTTVTVYVSNSGGADEPMPVTVELSGLDDGALLGSELLDSVSSGVDRVVQFDVASNGMGSGVRAFVTSPWAECQDMPNEAILNDLPCR